MTNHADLFRALQADFKPGEIKVRASRKDGKGPQLRYATARTFMNRLDEVLGPANWWDAYSHLTESSAICHLSIRLPDGTVVTKCDAGGAAGMADDGDDDKSIISDAFKRACVKFGVGRHLYNDGMPTLRDAVVHVIPSAADTDAAIERHRVMAEDMERQHRGTAVPQPEAVRPSSVQAEPEPAGLIGNPLSERNDIPFWDYLNDEVLKANYAYREETGDGNGCVDVKTAVKSVVGLTHRAGVHEHHPETKRTAKQWAQVVNEIAGTNRESRGWCEEYLRSHINIARETATLEASRAAR